MNKLNLFKKYNYIKKIKTAGKIYITKTLYIKEIKNNKPNY